MEEFNSGLNYLKNVSASGEGKEIRKRKIEIKNEESDGPALGAAVFSMIFYLWDD